MKRMMWIILTAVVLLTALWCGAAMADIIADGTCGENATWILNDDGELFILGFGEMEDYPGEFPGYYTYRNQIKNIIVVNPCNLIDPPMLDTQEAQYYDLSECPAILEAIKKYPDPEWRCYFIMQFYCGTRPEEMTGLNWSDFDGKNISISAGAYQAKGEKCKRTNKLKNKKSNRMIALPKDALDTMKEWRKVQSKERLKLGPHWVDSEAVFTNDLGERVSIQTPSKRWKSFTKESGIRHLPLYSLRHTNCSLLISLRELSVEDIASQMGHEQTSTTLNIYTHVFKKSNERATKALEKVLKKA